MTDVLKDATIKVAATIKEPLVMVVKANGKREPFDRTKLRASLARAGAEDEKIEFVMTHLESELYDDISTEDIYHHAFALLRKESRPAARRYSLRRAVIELGPSGFPFEDFVAEILRSKGYETETRQTVLGACVPHEVDVVAWRGDELLMVEAKFHNEPGAKSDLKVILYVKERFDDLSANLFNYGGKDRKISDFWLVTNTKFSSTAIHYGMCQKITLIGWNYPSQGNLQDMIEEQGLHPITCLTALTQSEKEVLLKSAIVLCSRIKEDPGILTRLLGPTFNSQPVLEEINEL
jgi:Holliday junction resolvase-like predicted endonuclease